MRRTNLEQTTPLSGKNRQMPKLLKNRPLRKTVPNQRKIGPEDKTHLLGIRSNQCRRGRLVTNKNTPHNKNGPSNEPNHQRRTTILYYNGIGQQPSNQIHNRQRIDGLFDTKTNVQQNHTYTAITHGVQRCQQQQNKKI